MTTSKSAQIVMKIFPAGAQEPRFIGRFEVSDSELTREDIGLFFQIERAINEGVAGRVHLEVVERFKEIDLDMRLQQRIEVANRLSVWISRQTTIPTHSAFVDVHVANQLLHDVIVENDRLTRALRSLVIGVEELQAEWPTLPDVASDGRLGELIGFLFATLPVSQTALK